jgi:hypothetical protein
VRAVVDLPVDPTGAQTLATPSGAPALRQPLRGAVVEFIDAALDDRHFDPARTGDSRSLNEACSRKASSPQQVSRNDTPITTTTNWGQPSSAVGRPNPWGFNNNGDAPPDPPAFNPDPPLARGQEDDARNHPPPEG